MKFEKPDDPAGEYLLQGKFKEFLESLPHKALPLQQALQNSSYAADTAFKACILNIEETESEIKIKAGIFYSGLIPGCSCADDPGPVDEINEYCEILCLINKSTKYVSIELIADS